MMNLLVCGGVDNCTEEEEDTVKGTYTLQHLYDVSST
jgi:hypothetical protein